MVAVDNITALVNVNDTTGKKGYQLLKHEDISDEEL